MNSRAEETYQVWAADNQVYGPIELPTLLQWVRERRVLPGTWVYSSSSAEPVWQEARTLAPLREALKAADETVLIDPTASAPQATVSASELRQFSIFASLSDEQLNEFLKFGELCCVQPNQVFLKKNEPGDALFFVLEGSVRARLMIGREDKTLGEIPAGQFFGEMAMFNHAPRSADVVGQSASRVFRLSSEAFLAMVRENPGLAAPILFALAGTMAGRVFDANSRFQREVTSGFLWS